MIRSIGEIIKDLRMKRGMTQSALAEKIGLKNQSTIAKWEKNENFPNGREVIKLTEIFNVSADYLLGLEDIKNFLPSTPATIAIPIIVVIACGNPIDADENIQGYIYKSPESVPSGKIIALQTIGDSMAPTIPPGAVALVRLQSEVEIGEIAAVLVNGDKEATLKRIKRHKDTLILSPDNNDYSPYIVNKDNPAKIIGKVVGYEMKF